MANRSIYSTLTALAAAAVMLVTPSCHSIDNYDNTVNDNFQLLWELFDEHYCFFREKGVDWDSVYNVYRPRALACRTQAELFNTCADMVNELRDGHVNIASAFNTSYYREWWSGYPQNFNQRVLDQYYLYFNQHSVGGSTYAVLLPNVGYIRIPTFTNGIGQGNIDYIFNYLATCQGLIIDVRNNGGGLMENVEQWVQRFIDKKTLMGYISHKTGPGHDDFSEPYAYYYAPPAGRQCWTEKPIVVLANRSTFSAANNFVSVMKLLPNVTVIGDTTGGGSGMPLSFELPVGWSVRMSAAPVLDAEGHTTEFGVEPTIHVDNTPEQEAAGHDNILDTAIALLSNC